MGEGKPNREDSIRCDIKESGYGVLACLNSNQRKHPCRVMD